MEPETKKIIWIVVIVILVLWLLPLILGVALSPFLSSSYSSKKDDVHIETMYNGYRSYPENTKFYDDKGYKLANKDLVSLGGMKHTCSFDQAHGYKTYSDGTYKVL